MMNTFLSISPFIWFGMLIQKSVLVWKSKLYLWKINYHFLFEVFWMLRMCRFSSHQGVYDLGFSAEHTLSSHTKSYAMVHHVEQTEVLVSGRSCKFIFCNLLSVAKQMCMFIKAEINILWCKQIMHVWFLKQKSLPHI